MELQVYYNTKYHYNYISLHRVKKIVDFNTQKREFIIIEKKKYDELLQELDRVKKQLESKNKERFLF